MSMKILLSLILCSGVAGECLPAYNWPEQFPDMYECMLEAMSNQRQKCYRLVEKKLINMTCMLSLLALQ